MIFLLTVVLWTYTVPEAILLGGFFICNDTGQSYCCLKSCPYFKWARYV